MSPTDLARMPTIHSGCSSRPHNITGLWRVQHGKVNVILAREEERYATLLLPACCGKAGGSIAAAFCVFLDNGADDTTESLVLFSDINCDVTMLVVPCGQNNLENKHQQGTICTKQTELGLQQRL